MTFRGSRSVLLICVAALLGGVALAEDYHPERTKLIDYYPRTSTPTNLLFRGNMPKINDSFAYQAIVDSMTTIAKQLNLAVPEKFTLVDISYLNLLEEVDLDVEEDFFKAHPDLGYLVKLPIFGTIFPPLQDDPSVIKDIVKVYIEDTSHDKLDKVMSTFRQLVVGKGPLLIYSHCEAGTDRTGEVSGAYYMRYLNMTFTEAVSVDDHIQSRDMYKDSRNELQWYCYYLKFVKNFTQLQCLV